MKQLYIVGAGGAAKEIYLLIKQINKVNPLYNFKGFIDVSSNRFLHIGENRYDVINELDFLTNYNNDLSIVFGLGDVNKLKKIVELYKRNKNISFPNIIHPNVNLDASVFAGVGNIIASHCVLTVDIFIGDFNYINRGVHIGHDSRLNSYNVINPCSVISGGVNIGDENLVGTNATILQYLSIGSNNKIGAGAVVTKNIENNSCMIGVPAKINK